jgi:hypothetical protein
MTQVKDERLILVQHGQICMVGTDASRSHAKRFGIRTELEPFLARNCHKVHMQRALHINVIQHNKQE